MAQIKVPDLTDDERTAINAAAEIIHSRTPKGATWFIDLSHYNSEVGWRIGATYFTADLRTQHSFLSGPTLADKVQTAIEAENGETYSQEEAKARRIARLRDELEKAEASL